MRPSDFRLMRVNVKIHDQFGNFLREYTTNLADDAQRRVFAEQMTAAYAALQITTVIPEIILKKENSNGYA